MSYQSDNLDEPRPVWLTRDECIDRYGFDPTGYPENVIRSKLSSSRGRQPQRVWLESEIVKWAQGG